MNCIGKVAGVSSETRKDMFYTLQHCINIFSDIILQYLQINCPMLLIICRNLSSFESGNSFHCAIYNRAHFII